MNYPIDYERLTDSSGNPINPAKEDGNLATINTTLAGIKSQTDKLTFTGSQLDVTSAVGFATRQDTFTATGNGQTVDVHTSPLTRYAIQVKGTGAAATSWDIVLEGSLDGVNFSTILEHVTSIGDGQVLWSGELDSPALYFRSRVIALSLGTATNVVVTILGD